MAGAPPPLGAAPGTPAVVAATLPLEVIGIAVVVLEAAARPPPLAAAAAAPVGVIGEADAEPGGTASMLVLCARMSLAGEHASAMSIPAHAPILVPNRLTLGPPATSGKPIRLPQLRSEANPDRPLQELCSATCSAYPVRALAEANGGANQGARSNGRIMSSFSEKYGDERFRDQLTACAGSR